jgi:hypothetical protein
VEPLNGQMLTCSSCGGLTPVDTSKTCLHCDALLRAPRWARKLSLLLGPAGALLLAACYGAPGRYYGRDNTPVPVDTDRDGVAGSFRCDYRNDCIENANKPALDCDDNDPARYPGAQDIDGDGIDQNCDGVDGWRDPATVATDPANPTAEPPKPPTPIATDPAP